MVWWCPSLWVSVRVSGSPSISPSIRLSVSYSFPHFSPTSFDILSWNFARDFILMYYRSSSSVGVMPLLELRILEIPSFFAFFSYMLWHIELEFCIKLWLCFTLLQIKFECCKLRQFLWEQCPFWNIEYWKYTVFHTFPWHALTYWAEMLHMT